MTFPRLYAILDVEVCARQSRAPLDVADAWLSAGVCFFQLRAKTLGSGPMLELAAALTERITSAGGLHVINDRADVAVLSGAGGVHVGQDDLPVEEARRVVGPAAVVGISTHTDAQVVAAARTSATYLAIGPVFGTATKATGYEAVGLDQVRRAVGAAGGRPVIAIGGITLESAVSVIDAGATSVAVISDLLAGDPEARARAFVSALG